VASSTSNRLLGDTKPSAEIDSLRRAYSTTVESTQVRFFGHIAHHASSRTAMAHLHAWHAHSASNGRLLRIATALACRWDRCSERNAFAVWASVVQNELVAREKEAVDSLHRDNERLMHMLKIADSDKEELAASLEGTRRYAIPCIKATCAYDWHAFCAVLSGFHVYLVFCFLNNRLRRFHPCCGCHTHVAFFPCYSTLLWLTAGWRRTGDIQSQEVNALQEMNASLRARSHSIGIRVLSRWQNKCAARAMEAWRCTTVDVARMQRKLDSMGRRWDRAGMVAAMKRWRHETHAVAVLRARLDRSSRNCLKRCLRNACQAWALRAAEERTRFVLVSRVVNMWARRMKVRFLFGWRSQAVAVRTRTNKGTRVAAMARQAMCRRAHYTWARHARAHVRSRYFESKTVRRCLLGVLVLWNSLTKKLAVVRTRCVGIRMRWQRRNEHATFVLWKHDTEAVRSLRKALSKLGEGKARHAMVRSLADWAHNVRMNLRARNLCRKAVARWQARAAGAAWAAWRSIWWVSPAVHGIPIVHVSHV
jgi:hypothetical protein